VVLPTCGGLTGLGRQARTVPDIYCTIILSEELGERFDGVFGGLALTHGSGRTRLDGRVVDQAALNGVLKQLMDLGLEIVSISTHPGEPE
jgi:hypothetical protein